MTLEQIAEKLREVLVNPNALVLEGNVLYFYARNRELLALRLDESA